MTDDKHNGAHTYIVIYDRKYLSTSTLVHMYEDRHEEDVTTVR